MIIISKALAASKPTIKQSAPWWTLPIALSFGLACSAESGVEGSSVQPMPAQGGADAPTAHGDDHAHHHDVRDDVSLSYDGVNGDSIAVLVANQSPSESARVELIGTVLAQSGSDAAYDFGSVELAPGESRLVQLTDSVHQFRTMLGDSATARLSIGARSHFAGGAIEQDAMRLYFDAEFSVKTPEEVDALAAHAAAHPGESVPALANAGIVMLSEERAEVLRQDQINLVEDVPTMVDLEQVLPAEVWEQMQAEEEWAPPTQGLGNDVLEGIAPAGATVSTRICLFLDAQWTDESIGDFLTAGAWTAQGFLMKVGTGSYTALGPANGLPHGCTATMNLTVGSSVTVRVQSSSVLPTGGGGTATIVANAQVGNPASQHKTFTVENKATHNVNIDATAGAMTAALSAATGLQLLRDGSSSNRTYTIHADDTSLSDPGGVCTGCVTGTGVIKLSSSADTYKFMVAHEVGHAVNALNMPKFYTTSGIIDYTNQTPANPAACSSAPAPATPTAHYATFTSSEWQSVAFTEGFADFFAAGAFNRKSENNCAFPTWTTGRDCDGTGWIPLAYHATQCGDAAGKGVQWDWLRFWWNVYQAKDFPTISGFMRAADATSYTRSNVYTKLNTAADSYSSINSTWDDLKDDHGIDN